MKKIIIRAKDTPYTENAYTSGCLPGQALINAVQKSDFRGVIAKAENPVDINTHNILT